MSTGKGGGNIKSPIQFKGADGTWLGRVLRNVPLLEGPGHTTNRLDSKSMVLERTVQGQ